MPNMTMPGMIPPGPGMLPPGGVPGMHGMMAGMLPGMPGGMPGMLPPHLMHLMAQSQLQQTPLEQEPKSEAKLFVGCIPNYVTEQMLREKFAEHGQIQKLIYMSDRVLTDRGWAFITYEDETEAAVAIALLHDSKPWSEKCPRALQVKFASEKITDLKGTAFDPAYVQNETVHTWTEHKTDDTPPKVYYHNTYTEETVWEQPYIMSQKPHTGVSASIPAAVNSTVTSGPPGANLFVYGIPSAWTDEDLHTRFKEFGTLVASKIYIDPTTMCSKGFGFVSYTTLDSATKAIEVMHGFEVEDGKLLRVSIKKGEENENPEAVAVVSKKLLQMPRNGPLAPLNYGVPGQKAQGLDGALNAISACYNKL